MAKEKVYKLAQEFKVSSEALVQMLRGMGIAVKSHMSTVDESLRDEVKKKFEQERAEIKKQYERKKKLLTKAKEELAEKQQEQEKKKEAAEAKAKKAKETAVKKTKPAPAKPFSQKREKDEQADKRAQTQQKPRIRKYHEKESWAKGKFTPSPAPAAEKGKTEVPGVTNAPPSAKPDTAKKDKGKKKSKRRGERPEIKEGELKANVKKTLARIGSGASKKKYKKEEALKPEAVLQEERPILNVAEFVTANELSNMMNVQPSDVIAKCLELGLFVTINQRLDFETIELVADEFGYNAQLMSEYAAETELEEEADNPEDREPRAPIVTVMGHVDHGKTSLLDYIRKENVISGEAGGITQHIAAYEVHTKNGSVTFLDTPGHEAFTAMRARGSQITDVIVLVVAADSAVMPQTREAIDHAKAANVPIVIAINKTDLASANVEKIKSELAQYNVIVEEYGGQTSCIEISAKTGKGIDKLLEVLALETEILELKANPKGKAHGVVIESELDRGKGPIATILIQRGTLKKGDAFVTGIHNGRVRELYNERGKPVEKATPSQPVLVLGLTGTPQAGDSFRVVEDEKEAREISGRRRLAQKERELRKIGSVSLDHLYEQIKAGDVQNLNLIIKGDVDGSVEALAASLERLSTEEIKVRVIHKSVGAIKETDILLAAASNALIIGFHLSPNTKIREMAKREGVEIRTYRIIYEVVDDVHNAMEGMLKPEIKENILSEVEIRKVFKISKLGTIAGCYVESGTVIRGAKARLIRDDVEVAESRIASLKRIQEDVREVNSGYECGITLEKVSDYREGDRIVTYEEVEIARKLS
ncbi:translation initiation factor IF-2 [Chitinispirillales bacterium ANBcel5]|uniref:translation initiation factor IF-2 n=1 Tax=Cellulosispirillum alkaliphilum TaxID=3039283 RepID=UPI002A53DAA8|nr:translation initiation factor IF-2 [Chitinispirillales bacterium ANBcel5]